MRYCPYCKRLVSPIRAKPAQLSWIALIILTLVTGGVFLILYVPFRFLTSIIGKPNRCPICNAKI